MIMFIIFKKLLTIQYIMSTNGNLLRTESNLLVIYLIIGVFDFVVLHCFYLFYVWIILSGLVFYSD